VIFCCFCFPSSSSASPACVKNPIASTAISSSTRHAHRRAARPAAAAAQVRRRRVVAAAGALAHDLAQRGGRDAIALAHEIVRVPHVLGLLGDELDGAGAAAHERPA